MKNFIRKYKWWAMGVGIVVFFLFPLLIELLLKQGLFGWKPFSTSFNMDDWFAFWGSYLGGGLTIVAISVSIRINNDNLKHEIDKEADLRKIELEQQKIAFDNELKIERALIEEHKIRGKYAEIIQDIKAVHRIFTEGSMSITGIIFKNEWALQGQKVMRIVDEIIFFCNKYDEMYDIAELCDFADYIFNVQKNIIEKINHFIPSSSEETIDEVDMCEQLSKCISEHGFKLREKADALIRSLRSKRDSEIEILFPNGGHPND